MRPLCPGPSCVTHPVSLCIDPGLSKKSPSCTIKWNMEIRNLKYGSAVDYQFPTFGHCATKPISATVNLGKPIPPKRLAPAPVVVAEAAGAIVI